VARRRYTLLDVFTRTRLEGNGLAVVHDADGVPDAVMHAFARETRLSETSFVQSPPDAGADYVHRIWMPSGELPFAGHPSLGTAVAVARARGQDRVTLVQQTHAGRQPIDVALDGDHAHASMLQEPAAFGEAPDPAQVMAAAGLEPGDAHPELPAMFVSTGVFHLMAPVRDADALGRVRIDPAALGRVLGVGAAVVLYLAHVDLDAGTARARSFIGTAGEDPATGSAAGPLCALVARHGGPDRLTIAQGAEMGRPSVLEARIEGERVRVGGDAVVVVDGTVALD
jgi:trans-2,3-dihydro-3-hydroxyanthranilate isomerase